MKRDRARVLAVASSGGHWTQLLRVIPAFSSFDIAFVTVLKSYRSDVPDHRFYVVNDANRWNKLAMIRAALRIGWIVVKERPEVVVSTGAAPGYFALLFGRMLGAKTIWIDSITNIDSLSMSGSLVGKYADLWLTQWPHLAKPGGPQCGGAVL